MLFLCRWAIMQLVKKRGRACVEIITEEMVKAALPKRRENDHKGTFGTLLCLCGSERYPGAARLCTEGALRCGAGIVALAAPQAAAPLLTTLSPECTLLPLPEEGGDALAEGAGAATAFLAGCGLGESALAKRRVAFLLRQKKPMVLDADGLNLLSEDSALLQGGRAGLVLTPHPGEMARLLKTQTAWVQENRQKAALLCAKQFGAVTVLKGAHTLVALPNGALVQNETGNPGLAKGGSGDLLAGMIASFLAQGLSPRQAALCGVYLHGAAADRCAARLSMAGMLPSDLLLDLCALFLEMGF